MISDVTDLRVYKQSLDALRKIYKLASFIPDDNIKLRRQIISSAESVPPLIAEGFGKRSSTKEFKRFLDMAMGSSDETITHARVALVLRERINRIPEDTCNEICEEYKSISKQLNSLKNKWNNFSQ